MRTLSISAIVVMCGLGAFAHGHSALAQTPAILGGRPLLHAHNAYVEEGRWADRIDRALATGQVPLVIEQDIAYAARNEPGIDRSVVSHDDELKGSEPPLRQHFFDRVRPIIEKALAAGDTQRWPVLVLHLDFKTNGREHHRAVWDLLKRHRQWLTTAPPDSDLMRVTDMKPGPLLVLTENGAGQERDFTEWAAEEGSLLLFGSIPAPALRQSDDPAERARMLRAAPPNQLVPAAASSYRRWVNFSWAAVEEGGPSKAGEWTRDDAERLDAIVRYAHLQGLLVRFYTLNGHTAAASRGWGESYNFGDLEAARLRWRAAAQSGVDLIASDQYEEVAALLQAPRQ
jgi:hypothetical protein